MYRLLAVSVAALGVGVSIAQAQWTLQESHTTASLRGIHYVGGSVAWASGTSGTVLRTLDMGKTWTQCTVPPGAEKLDFRGVQAFDAKTAIVMSSGKGDLSRLYKTTDGCVTWKLIHTNNEPEGFWDALVFRGSSYGVLLGDPVGNSFFLAETADGGKTWVQEKSAGLKADAKFQGAFAASNSSLHVANVFGTGGVDGAFIYRESEVTVCVDACPDRDLNLDGSKNKWVKVQVPVGAKTEASGIFSIAGKQLPTTYGMPERLVAVGGDYTKPDASERTAAFSTDHGETWQAADVPPSGYRSSVAYEMKSKVLVTVGPNGTDVSTDDGKNWHSLKPRKADAPDADKNWNALSLPFVVGPKGRIGLLRSDALVDAKQ